MRSGIIGPDASHAQSTTPPTFGTWESLAMRVLVVDDHAKLAMTIATGLRQAGMAVDVAFDGRDALEHAALADYDVIVLDRDIPKVHGDEVCRTLTSEGSTSRVLMLTAAGGVEDRVYGLELGADDYLAKPCDFSELLARVRALIRRPGAALPPTLTYGDLELDPSRRVVRRAGVPLNLNPKEFAVLEVLLAAPGVAVSAEELLLRVWDEMADPFSQAVRTTVSRLRAKLGEPPLIHTVAKVGYRVGG
jgi:DNA-binding response OmpR family regulator